MDEYFGYKTVVAYLTVIIRCYVSCDSVSPHTDYDLYRLVSAFQRKYESTDGFKYTDLTQPENKTEEILPYSVYHQNFQEDPLRRSIKKLFREKDKSGIKSFPKVGDFIKNFKINNGENMAFAFMGNSNKQSDRRSQQTVQRETKYVKKIFNRKLSSSIQPSKPTSTSNFFNRISVPMESRYGRNIPISDESSTEVKEAIKGRGIFKQIGASKTSTNPRIIEFQEKDESIRFQSDFSKGKDKFHETYQGDTGKSRSGNGTNDRENNSTFDRSIRYLQTRNRSREKWNYRLHNTKTSIKAKRRWPAPGIPKSDAQRRNIATSEWPSTNHGIFDEDKYLEIETTGKTTEYAAKKDFKSRYVGKFESDSRDATSGKFNLSRITYPDRSRRQYSEISIQPAKNATQTHKTGGQGSTNNGRRPIKLSAAKLNMNNDKEIDNILKNILPTVPQTRTEKDILKALKVALTRFKDPSLALEILLGQKTYVR